MSTFSDSIGSNVQAVLTTGWDVRNGQVVPTTEAVKLAGGAVKVAATWLYADLADSSGAAHRLNAGATGKIVRSYLDASTRIIRHFGGEIRSFDGDRVMGIFIGADKNLRAVKAGLGINWAVHKVLQPRFAATWRDLANLWTLGHGVGIDTGDALIIRGGVRDNNDLVSIGPAPNVAAKLSGLRSSHQVYITDRVFDDATPAGRVAANGTNFWSWYSPPQNIGGVTYKVLSSNWMWTP